jgi:hypothetical protein
MEADIEAIEGTIDPVQQGLEEQPAKKLGDHVFRFTQDSIKEEMYCSEPAYINSANSVWRFLAARYCRMTKYQYAVTKSTAAASAFKLPPVRSIIFTTTPPSLPFSSLLPLPPLIFLARHP